MASEPAGAGTGRVRPARPADLPRILRLERDSFAVPWSDRAFRTVMARPDASLLVVERSGEPVGYVAVWMEGRDAELGDLAVAPEHRRDGLGTVLVEAAASAARERGAARIYLQVRESNDPARRLYRSTGFRRVGRKRGYYHAPREDALVLIRDTAPPR